MERWRPETNTFFRDIYITLGDVARVLGKPRMGILLSALSAIATRWTPLRASGVSSRGKALA